MTVEGRNLIRSIALATTGPLMLMFRKSAPGTSGNPTGIENQRGGSEDLLTTWLRAAGHLRTNNKAYRIHVTPQYKAFANAIPGIILAVKPTDIYLTGGR